MPHPVKSECGIESATSKRRRQVGRRRGLKKGASSGVRVFRSVCGRLAAQATARTASRKNGTEKQNRTPERGASRRALRTDPATGCVEDGGISFEGRGRGRHSRHGAPGGTSAPPGHCGHEKGRARVHGSEAGSPEENTLRTRTQKDPERVHGLGTGSERVRGPALPARGLSEGTSAPPGKGGVPPHPLTTPRGRSEAIFRAMPARCTTSTTLSTSLYARGASSTRVLSE